MQCITHDKSARTRIFVPGDKVYTHYGGLKLTWVEGKICEATGPVSYVVHLEDRHVMKRQIDHIRCHYDDSDKTPPDLVDLDIVKPVPVATPTSTPIPPSTPMDQPEHPVPEVETPVSIPTSTTSQVESPSPEVQDSSVLRRSDRVRRAPKRWE